MGKKKKRNKKAAPSSGSTEQALQPETTPPATHTGFFKQYAVVIAFLIALVSFFVHLKGADFEHRNKITTMDESVYSRLGYQLKEGGGYNTIQMYQENLRVGRELPDYFKKPLFKHPPFFSYLISLSYTFLEKKRGYSFEELYALSSKVSNLMGCALIFIVFLLGRRMYDYRVGLSAALILAMEVNFLNASQKVWMATTLTTMVWLTFFFLHKALDKRWFFVLAGICGGLALLTKYPAGILFIAFLSYAAVFEKRIFRQYQFYLFLFVSGVIFMPWVLLNIETYDISSLQEYMEIQGASFAIKRMIPFAWLLGAVALIVAGFQFIRKKHKLLYQKITSYFYILEYTGLVVFTGFLVYLLSQADFRASLIDSLVWLSYPSAGWKLYMFSSAPKYFYFKQILAYSPFYIYFFAGMLMAPFGNKDDKLLMIISVWMLLFTSLWGSFQGRYILMLVPAAMLLISKTIWEIIDYLLRERTPLRIACTTVFILSLVYFAIRTAQVSYFNAFAANVAYY